MSEPDAPFRKQVHVDVSLGVAWKFRPDTCSAKVVMPNHVKLEIGFLLLRAVSFPLRAPGPPNLLWFQQIIATRVMRPRQENQLRDNHYVRNKSNPLRLPLAYFPHFSASGGRVAHEKV